MARIDDYKTARNIAIEKLSKRSFDDIAAATGFETIDDRTVRVPFLNRSYTVNFPACDFKDESHGDEEIPIQEQVLILHYILAGSILKKTGKQISYREIPGASFYFSSFIKRAIDPLKKVFGHNISGLKKAASRIGGIEIEAGDAGFEFKIFPRVSIQLILWEGDDEFPSEANIVFDDTIGEIMSPEDVAWLSGMLVYRLISLA